MIVSVSRRTDIPAYYSDWFYNRLREGYCLTRNPFNRKKVYDISLKKEDVDCFVFWTKNPRSFMTRIDELEGYSYYFQFTLTSYGDDVEANVERKNDNIKTFKKLSSKIGKEKVIWRYDPILLTDKYTEEYHYKWFQVMAKKLEGYTDKCVISFLDLYEKTKKNMMEFSIIDLDKNIIKEMAKKLSAIAKKYHIKLETCSEKIDLDEFDITHGACIDDELIRQITNQSCVIDKDQNQRKECGCVRSKDIGEYNTCLHHCKYCYANVNWKKVNKNAILHNPNSPLLIGELVGDEEIEKAVEHMTLFNSERNGDV